MRKALGILISSLTLLVWVVPAHAELVFSAELTVDQEPHDVTLLEDDDLTPRPTPFGQGIFILNDEGTALTMDVVVFNIDFTGSQTATLNDNLLNAHIHVLPSFADAAGPVRWGFIGTPFNDVEPTKNVVVTPFTDGVGGRVTGAWDALEGNNTTLTDQLPSILAGLAYINFHTVENPAGEVRGQIELLQVPEPGTLLLVGLGLAGLLASRKRIA